jgi:hypothetical protein
MLQVKRRLAHRSMLDTIGTNPTQLIGILAFGAASITCFLSSRRPGYPDVRAWKLLGFIHLLFTIEILVGFRHQVHNLVVSILIEYGDYNQRSSVQEILILLSVLIFLTLIATIFVFFRPREWSTIFAVSSTIVVIPLFAIETVSLHAVDAVLYRPIASVMIVGWIWAIAGCSIVLAALFRSSPTCFHARGKP